MNMTHAHSVGNRADKGYIEDTYDPYGAMKTTNYTSKLNEKAARSRSNERNSKSVLGTQELNKKLANMTQSSWT